MKKHWTEHIADILIRKFPERDTFVCAAGISPSGTVHIGNFRDIITAEAVYRELISRNKKAKLIFSWDNFDRFRKVPINIPKEYDEFIGLPLSKVPNPFGNGSYADHFQGEFEDSLAILGIYPEFKYQKELYLSGQYNELILLAMERRKEIAKVLSNFKTIKLSSEEIQNYYPIEVYCEKCGKDQTEILSYHSSSFTLEYSCVLCHNENAVDISKKCIGKLPWKVDWPMRWKYENVCFEPGGKDHSTEGGSYDVSKVIAKEIFSIDAPYYQPYDFIGLSGLSAKMSGSSGVNVSPIELLKIYEPELLRWLFLRTHPKKAFNFCFDSEIIRQYDDFDKEVKKYLNEKLDSQKKKAIEFSKINEKDSFYDNPVSFRQVATFGQVTSGNISELLRIFKDIGTDYHYDSIVKRTKLSTNWINTYATDLKISLRDAPNIDYYKNLTVEEQNQIIVFANQLDDNWDLEKLTKLAYDIPKDISLSDEENKKRQRQFFIDLYQLLVNKDTGPRLPTFLISLGLERTKYLLDFNQIK